MSSTAARAAILSTLRAGLKASPLAVPAPPARPASVSLGPDAWEQLAAVLEPLEVRLRLARTPAEAASHVADIARERSCATYTRWDSALNFLPLDAALAHLTVACRAESPETIADAITQQLENQLHED